MRGHDARRLAADACRPGPHGGAAGAVPHGRASLRLVLVRRAADHSGRSASSGRDQTRKSSPRQNTQETSR
jgi:hypothetical protein